jgi:hypothetical protein
MPPAASYNRTGRAYPDVSARAVAFAIVLKGAETSVDGTSGACECRRVPLEIYTAPQLTTSCRDSL